VHACGFGWLVSVFQIVKRYPVLEDLLCADRRQGDTMTDVREMGGNHVVMGGRGLSERLAMRRAGSRQ
jgi:hypothetical protein